MRVAVVGVWVLAAVVASAREVQAQAAVAPAGDLDAGVDLVTKVRNRGETVTYKSGWHGGASYRVADIISVLGEASGDYRKLTGYTANRYAYSGGVRFEAGAVQPVRPFIQIMMGAAQDNGDGTGKTNHYPVVSPGGGADFRLAGRAALRVRLDFPLYMTFGDVFKGTRLAAGVSVGMGHR